MITVPERHGQTDRQTTYCGITALCVTSRGKTEEYLNLRQLHSTTFKCNILHVQSTDDSQGRQSHVVSLDLLPVKLSDAGTYECLVKAFDGAAVAATVNLTVYGKIYLYFYISTLSQ